MHLPDRKRRKRRRRRQNRPPVSAHLLVDERLKGEAALLSEDLYADLFPSHREGDAAQHSKPVNPPSRHVAITPWAPLSLASPQSTTWTIVPVLPEPTQDSSVPHSSVKIPPASTALQSFLRYVKTVSPGKTLLRKDSPIEIRVVDVAPVGLESVFVTLNTDALAKLHSALLKYGGGFGHDAQTSGFGQRMTAKGYGKRKADDRVGEWEFTWRQAVRKALDSRHLVHTGDLLPLPLPSHPISHISPPSVRVTACEPLSQGLLLPSTRIVIIHTHEKEKRPKPVASPIGNGIPEEDEDTSTEVFYSANEEKNSSPSSTTEENTDFTDTQSINTENDNLSDDDDDMISLNAPMLPAQSSGVLSVYASATPRAGALYSHAVATPGSLHSGLSSSTVRGPSTQGKVFKAYGLLQRIPEELLHPKPVAEDDEEARIYVDTSALVRIGCFSGDWVRIEIAPEPNSGGFAFAPWHLGALGEEMEESKEWRTAKVYGLPDSLNKKQLRTSRKPKRSAFMDLSPSDYPAVFAPPILLANMSNASYIRLSSLAAHASQASRPASSSGKRLTSSSLPPPAKEVTITKIATPLSTDKQLQPILFACLKDYFEGKRRIVKSGDFVGIAVDENLGRTVFSTGDDGLNDDLLSRSKNRTRPAPNARKNGSTAVAWFKVGSVVASSTEADPDVWGGVCFVDATLDATNTKMVQTGSEQSTIPPAFKNSWQQYLGLRKLPAPGSRSSPSLSSMEIQPPYISSLRRRLKELISASTSPQAVHLGLPPLAILLTSTQRQVGKALTATRACEDLGLHIFAIDAYDILSEAGAGGGDVKTELTLKARAERAMSCGPQYTVLLVQHVDALSAARMTAAFKEILSNSRVIIATSTEVDKIPESIRALFTQELEITAPDESEREGILRDIVDSNSIRLAPDVELSSVALKTAALVAGDLVDVMHRARIAKSSRLEALASAANAENSNGTTVTIMDLEIAGGSSALALTRPDLEAAVDAARKNFADAIGAPKIPNVSWDDVGGLAHVKDAVVETIQLPLQRPELFAKGMKKRSGILFYGPPGTGKTLLAKAIATEFSLNFFSVKGPELLNMYIGESEANVRRVFQRARDARPCVVFFDELDSVAPKRGNQGDSGGVMDRIVSQLLAELDGMSNGEEGGGGVFVIGATNRPDLLDQALLRPGRFDKMLYLGVSDTHEKQLTILEALTRKFTLSPNLSLRRVAQSLPLTYTGADLYALSSDAMLKAITRSARLVDAKVATHNAALPPEATKISVAHFFDHLATEEDTSVEVEEQDFYDAQKELVPSVSKEELGHYERVRMAFEGTRQGGGENKKAGPNGGGGGGGGKWVSRKPEGLVLRQNHSPLTSSSLMQQDERMALRSEKGKENAAQIRLADDASARSSSAKSVERSDSLRSFGSDTTNTTLTNNGSSYNTLRRSSPFPSDHPFPKRDRLRSPVRDTHPLRQSSQHIPRSSDGGPGPTSLARHNSTGLRAAVAMAGSESSPLRREISVSLEDASLGGSSAVPSSPPASQSSHSQPVPSTSPTRRTVSDAVSTATTLVQYRRDGSLLSQPRSPRSPPPITRPESFLARGQGRPESLISRRSDATALDGSSAGQPRRRESGGSTFYFQAGEGEGATDGVDGIAEESEKPADEDEYIIRTDHLDGAALANNHILQQSSISAGQGPSYVKTNGSANPLPRAESASPSQTFQHPGSAPLPASIPRSPSSPPQSHFAPPKTSPPPASSLPSPPLQPSAFPASKAPFNHPRSFSSSARERPPSIGFVSSTSANAAAMASAGGYSQVLPGSGGINGTAIGPGPADHLHSGGGTLAPENTPSPGPTIHTGHHHAQNHGQYHANTSSHSINPPRHQLHHSPSIPSSGFSSSSSNASGGRESSTHNASLFRSVSGFVRGRKGKGKRGLSIGSSGGGASPPPPPSLYQQQQHAQQGFGMGISSPGFSPVPAPPPQRALTIGGGGSGGTSVGHASHAGSMSGAIGAPGAASSSSGGMVRQGSSAGAGAGQAQFGNPTDGDEELYP